MVLHFKGTGKMKKLIIYTTIAIFLVGCGGGGSGGDGTSNSETSYNVGIVSKGDEVMIISQPYLVQPGDKVIKTSDNALLKIRHTDKKRESVIKLLEGNATITRKL